MTSGGRFISWSTRHQCSQHWGCARWRCYQKAPALGCADKSLIHSHVLHCGFGCYWHLSGASDKRETWCYLPVRARSLQCTRPAELRAAADEGCGWWVLSGKAQPVSSQMFTLLHLVLKADDRTWEVPKAPVTYSWCKTSVLILPLGKGCVVTGHPIPKAKPNAHIGDH